MCFLNGKIHMSDVNGKIYALCALLQLDAESTVHNGVLSELSHPKNLWTRFQLEELPPCVEKCLAEDGVVEPSCGAFSERPNQRLSRIGELLDFELFSDMNMPLRTWTLATEEEATFFPLRTRTIPYFLCSLWQRHHSSNVRHISLFV